MRRASDFAVRLALVMCGSLWGVCATTAPTYWILVAFGGLLVLGVITPSPESV